MIDMPKVVLKNMDMTVREFKQEKRRLLKHMLGVLSRYRLGCAYCPDRGENAKKIEDTLKAMINDHSIKKWGR